MAQQKTSTPPPEVQQEIAQAAAEKAAEGGSEAQVATAAQQAARAEGYELTDEQAELIADKLTNKLLEGLDKRGVFREEPEPVTVPQAAPPAPADQTAAVPAAAPVPVTPDAPPRKPTFAERHFN